ncbi:MAG: hypothetical protein ACRCZO_20530, partial [Cetobacterium sp.]
SDLLQERRGISFGNTPGRVPFCKLKDYASRKISQPQTRKQGVDYGPRWTKPEKKAKLLILAGRERSSMAEKYVQPRCTV